MKKSLAKKSKKGFTLIELVVVIAILGILAAILIPVIGGFISRANRAADLANARNLFNSAAIYIATENLTAAPSATTLAAAISPGMINLPATGWSVSYSTTGGLSVASATFGTATYNANGSVSYSSTTPAATTT